jgi:CotH kinase protein/Lamin Tail Domain
MQKQPKMRRRHRFIANALLGIALLAASLAWPFGASAQQQEPGDSVFSGLQVHVVNVKFDKPWSEIEPILKANKQNEIYIPASLEINCIPAGHPGCVKMDSVGVRHKGNSTFNQNRAKNPFRFSFDEYGIDQRWDGLKGFTLNNAWSDPSHMNEKIHLDFAHKAGIAGPRANFAWLYINDTLFSFYSLVELADKHLLQSRFGDKDGDLFKANDLVGGGQVSDFVRRSPFDASAYLNRFENKSDSVERAWDRLVRFIDTLNLATDIASVLPRIADVNALYRAFGSDNLFNNTDSYAQSGQNYLFYFPQAAGPMEWILWDVSLSMGTRGTARTLTQANTNRPLANRIMDTPALREDYLRALWFMYNAHFAGTWLRDRIDSVAQFIRPHITADTRKLSTLAAFESDIDTLKNFITTRQSYVQGSSGFSSASNGNISAANAIRSGDIVISEIAAAQGWVEVHNTRTYSIDLSGHSLSDNAAQPDKWNFPLGSFVEPGDYRVIALQGGSAGTSGPTNFSLSATGGYLRLSRANETVVDSITFGAQQGDRTISRFGTSFGEGAATPGKPNVDATTPVTQPPVVINEFMADNDTLTAPVGMKADWVELYNTTSSPVSLAGMYLSDSRDNPSKWQFPTGTTIPANGYLVVWAYDTTFAGSMHASWALSRSGEHIRLSNADLSVMDSLTFGEQAKSRSMARLPNGSGAFQSACLPTLGAANTAPCATAGLAGGAVRSEVRFELLQGGPGQTVARFALSAPGRMRLTVHDLRGREVAVLADGFLPVGPHAFTFNASALPVGTYFFRLRTEGTESFRARVLAR